MALKNTAMPATQKKSEFDVEVRPESTVLHQIDKVIDKGGPLMQRADTIGTQKANRRGLINSNMAIESAENAVYNYALPIASQDASTYGSADMQNASGATQRAIAAGNNQTSLAVAGMSLEATRMGLEAERENQERRFQQQQQLDADQFSRSKELEQIRFDQNKFMEQLTHQNQRLMQASSSAAAVYANANTAIANVLADPNTTVTAKQQLVDQLNRQLERQIQMIGAFSDVDTGNLLQFAA